MWKKNDTSVEEAKGYLSVLRPIRQVRDSINIIFKYYFQPHCVRDSIRTLPIGFHFMKNLYT